MHDEPWLIRFNSTFIELADTNYRYAAYLLMSAFNPGTLAVVLVYLIVVYFLEKFKDSAIHSWLENCVFGILNSYKDPEVEMRELGKALE